MKRLFFALIVAGCALSIILIGLSLAPTFVLAAPGQQDGPPPQVITTDPQPGEEISIDQPIIITFNQPMDITSLNETYSSEPEANGEFVPGDDAETYIFVPSQPLTRATTYIFTIGENTLGTNGIPMRESFTLRFHTQGYLYVTETLPADGAVGIGTDTAITVIFNRPVVPLVTVEEMDTLPDPLVITPEVSGTGEWLNTSIYTFQPDQLAGGTTYTVAVPSGLTDVTGGILQETVTWSFETTRPAVMSISPTRGSEDNGIYQPVTVSFNQPMDPPSVEAAFSLISDTNIPISGTFEWQEGNITFAFQPDDALALSGVYTATIDAKTARASNGTTPLQESTTWTFAVVGPPEILYTEPGDESLVNAYGGFAIFFNTEMDETTLEDKVIIEPAPEDDFYAYFSTYNNRYNLSFSRLPSTDYTVTILPGMADIYGNTIETTTVLRFSTQPYEPGISLQVPGNIGLYSAYAPETRLFSTYLNVSQIDISLQTASLEDLINLTGPASWDYWRAYNPTTVGPNVRNWAQPLEVVQNQRRYQLLTLSMEGESIAPTCEGAPEPRLQVGGAAIVITEPDPLRARDSYLPDADIMELLYKDYEIPVTAGPECNRGFYWWQILLRDGTAAWIAEGDATEYYVEPLNVEVGDPQNTPITTALPDGASLQPGVYYLRVDSQETASFGEEPLRHMLVVATANITLKVSKDSALAWVTDLESGLPVPGTEVVFYDSWGIPITTATTDQDGLAQVTIPRQADLYDYIYAVANTTDTFAYAVNDWTRGIEPYDFNQRSNYYPQDTKVYLYTDRPIYRPGQPVLFRGVTRDQDDVTYTAPSFEDMRILIENDTGDIIYDERLPLTEYGSFNGEINLSEDAALGYYRLIAELEDGTHTNARNEILYFSVAEYRAPEFQVTVTPHMDEVVQGETIQVMVDGTYFFGGPVSNADVSYSVTTQDHYFRYSGSERYDFIDYNYDSGPRDYYGYSYGEQIISGSGTTDDNGNFYVEIPADLGDKTQSQILTIEAGISDESDQAIYNRSAVIVHQGEVYVGIRPDRYVGRAGEENLMHLITVDWESEPVAGQDISIDVVERRWSSVQEEDDFGRTTWVWEVEEIPVEDTINSVTSNDDGTANFTFTPETAGTYKAYASTRDAQGNEVRSSTYMWVSGSQYVPWRQQNSNRVDLITDRDSYEVGDTAEILIASPWQGTATALITIERGDIISQEVITLESNSTVYQLPIEADYAPNVFVSVMLVKGVDETTPVAEFRMGLAQIAVNPAHYEISVTVVPDRERAGPRETVTYTVETTDHEGNPVEAEVGIGLTDLSVLSIADPNSQPLMQAFYSQQGLGVRTANPLTISTDQLTQTTLDTVKGGGGGGGGGGGIFEVRQEFIDTPYWNPVLVTNAQGTATIDITLPDNLTTWRLDARAFSAGIGETTLVGQAEHDLISTKPLLVRPTVPRFFVVGDMVTLVAVVNNNTGEAMTVDAAINATGIAFNSPIDVTADIPADGRHRFEWVVTVNDVENADITFFASGNEGAYTDAAKPLTGIGDDRLVPVYRYEAPETVGTGGMITEAATITEAISLPRNFDVTQGELTVRVEPSLAATTLDGLDYLANFPHQCTEQTVSAFLPNIMTYRALDNLGLADTTLRESLEREVSWGIQRLYAQQHADGGWGWFMTSDSNPLTTAYALIGLTEADNAGFGVSDEVIIRAVSFLNGQMAVINDSTSTYQLNRQAFMLYALARAEHGNISRTMTLYDYRTRLSQYAQAYLAVTMHRLDSLDVPDEVNGLVAGLFSNAILSATGAHWEEDFVDYWNWNTDTRTTAIVLGALIELEPKNPLLAQAVRWLMVARTADHWETTQETAWSLMALTDWMVSTGELEPAYAMGVTLNGETLLDAQATAQTVDETMLMRVEVADLLADAPNVLNMTHGDGPGVMYYTAHLRAFLPVPEIDPLNRGIILDRRYSLSSDEDRTPIEGANVGENVRVTLTIIAPNDLHYVVIEDPIPAGSDAVDPNLNTSQQEGTGPEVERTDPLSYGWGWWYFSQIEYRDEKVVIYADYLPAGTYEYSYVIRPGLPGEYNVIPPTGQEFYFPEVYGRGAGSTFTITEEVAE